MAIPPPNFADADLTVARRPRRSEKTGERLLEAGRRMVLEYGMSSRLPVRISDVVASVGQTTGAAYQLWPSQDKYQRALADYLLENTFWNEPRAAIDEIRATLDAESTLAQTIRKICQALMGSLIGQPEYYVHLHFSAVAFHESDLREAMRLGYERFHDDFRGLYADVFAKYVVKLKDPYSIDDVATTITAIAEGFAIRALVDAQRTGRPEQTDWNLFSRAVEAIVLGFTEAA